MKLFSLIYQGDIHPSKDEKVIPAEAYSQLLSAEEVLNKAREDAEAFLEKTRKKAEELKEEAKEAGLQEGLSTFNEAVLNFDREIKKLRHEMHRMVLPIALKAAQKIVGDQLKLHPETIVDIVLKAIGPISQSHRVTIFVSKNDKQYLDAERAKIKEILAQVDSLSIQEKAGLSDGSCVIQTEKGLINATLENQWEALERAFQKAISQA